jgi:hypothetical protein
MIQVKVGISTKVIEKFSIQAFRSSKTAPQI